jgi:hypothetical protein
VKIEYTRRCIEILGGEKLPTFLHYLVSGRKFELPQKHPAFSTDLSKYVVIIINEYFLFTTTTTTAITVSG